MPKSLIAVLVMAMAVLGPSATFAADTTSPEARTLFDSCISVPNSTAASCRCGVDYYQGHLSQSDLALVAAMSSGVVLGEQNPFDAAATKMGLSPAEKGAALGRIRNAVGAAAQACDHLVVRPEKAAQ